LLGESFLLPTILAKMFKGMGRAVGDKTYNEGSTETIWKTVGTCVVVIAATNSHPRYFKYTMPLGLVGIAAMWKDELLALGQPPGKLPEKIAALGKETPES
jgi:hypothetical protein